MLEPLDGRQRFGLDLVEATQIAGQRVDLALDRLAAQILQVIVVRVHAVERRVGRVRLVKIGEQIVDEMGQRFRNDHRVSATGNSTSGECERFSWPAIPIRQWYNKLRVLMPGTLFVVATPIGNVLRPPPFGRTGRRFCGRRPSGGLADGVCGRRPSGGLADVGCHVTRARADQLVDIDRVTREQVTCERLRHARGRLDQLRVGSGIMPERTQELARLRVPAAG